MKKLVVLASRSPLPLQKGDKLRLYHQLRFLSKQYSIFLIALQQQEATTEERSELESFCKEVHLFSMSMWQNMRQMVEGGVRGFPLTVAYFFSSSVNEQIRQIVERIGPDHIYCQLIRMAPYAEGIDIPKSIDYMDAFSLRAQRLAAKKLALINMLWKREESLLHQYEKQVHRWFCQHFIISEVDQKHLSIAGREPPTLLQNGVDAKYFDRSPYGLAKEKSLVLIGNMSYHPNVMAAKYLVKELGPLLWRQDKDIRIVIAGADPRRSVRALAGERVEVLGFVEDIRSIYALGSVFVAPIFTGSGLQNKILEAMAMECPCVTTSIVQDSIPFSSGIVQVADDAQKFSDIILELLASPETGNKIAAEGREMVLKHYSWEQACLPLLSLSS